MLREPFAVRQIGLCRPFALRVWFEAPLVDVLQMLALPLPHGLVLGRKLLVSAALDAAHRTEVAKELKVEIIRRRHHLGLEQLARRRDDHGFRV